MQIRPVLQFVTACRDPVVVAEVAHVLMSVVVDGGPRALATVVDVARGPEEFAAMVLQRLVAADDDPLRCAGLRLLTQFYLRVEQLPMTALAMTVRRRKGSIAVAAFARSSTLSRAFANPVKHARRVEENTRRHPPRSAR